MVLPVFLLRGSDEPGDPFARLALRAAAGGRCGMSGGMNGGMNGVYGEPVEVQARADGRPVRFVWRSRLYAVRAIFEHWVVNREWWRDPGQAGHSGLGQPELEFWRVEAAPGQGMTAGVYELRRETATGAWTLRVNLTGRAPQVPIPVRRGSGKWLPQVAQTQLTNANSRPFGIKRTTLPNGRPRLPQLSRLRPWATRRWARAT